MAKLRAFIPLLLTAVLLIGAAASFGVANSQSANGKYDADGDKLIEVSNLEQLDAIRYDLDGDGQADAESGRDSYAAAFPVSGSETVCLANCNGYELARSLDFDAADSYASGATNVSWTTGSGWLPIGNNSQFEAILDGNGYTVGNLYINRTTQFNNPGTASLLGHTSSIIRKIGMVDVDVTGVTGVGGLAGWNSGTIRDSYATGNVSGESEVGGLVGGNGSVISNSYATVTIDGGNSIGGLAGDNQGTISGSYATGNVSGYYAVGGLVGENWAGTISGNYATGDVTGERSIGGLVGYNFDRGTISGSYTTGRVISTGEKVGGLVGENGGTITVSYSNGEVSGESEVGGLVGESVGTITVSYATGEVSGESEVGGLVGESDSTILISYSTGRVTGNNNVGGLVGAVGDNATVVASYWDTQTSGQATSAAGEGKATAELQSPTGYTGVYAAWRIDIDNADQDFDQSTGVDDVWDFGTFSQYPAVKADFDGDGVATWQEFGNQRPQSPAPTARPTAASTPASTTGAVDSNARPSDAMFGELVNAGLLASVWRYHNATASWDAYDPNIPAELNDLTHAAPKDIVWVKVTKTTQFQGRTLHKGWNLITLK